MRLCGNPVSQSLVKSNGLLDFTPQSRNATAAPMSAHRLLVCLAVIGWPERELARRTGACK